MKCDNCKNEKWFIKTEEVISEWVETTFGLRKLDQRSKVSWSCSACDSLDVFERSEK